MSGSPRRRSLGSICLAVMLAVACPASARELRLATWDFGWLTTDAAGLPGNVHPASQDDLARLARTAAALDADVIALQGVDAAAEAVFPPARYSVVVAGDDVREHTGFAIRRGLGFVRDQDVVALDPYPSARLHLRAGTAITLTLGAMRLRLLSVHLKSGCRDAPLDGDRAECATLGRQFGVLRDWVGDQQGPFAILGDFGRGMDGDDSLRRIGGGGGLLRATAGLASPCRGGGSFVDHVLLGGGAQPWVQSGSLRVMVGGGTSHCPVSVRLRLPD